MGAGAAAPAARSEGAFTRTVTLALLPSPTAAPGPLSARPQPMSKLALMQSQLQQLKEENTMLSKEKSDWEEHKKHLVEEYTKLTATAATRW